MYDWNALWEDNTDRIKTLEAPLSGPPDAARAVATTDGETPLTVYETDEAFLLARQAPPALLTLPKRELFELTLRFVPENESGEPEVNILVDNLATGESDAWRSPVRRDDEGRLWVGSRLLGEGVLPPMPFDDLSFTDNASFRDALYRLWQDDLPQLAPLIESHFSGELSRLAEAAPSGADGFEGGRLDQICDRYAEIVRREQAVLSRLFSDDELRLVAEVIRPLTFDSAASCRGLWLAVEARLVDDEIDRALGVDAARLLQRLKDLSYAQEVALIEALSPHSA